MKETLNSLRIILLCLFTLIALVCKSQHIKSVMVNACSGGGSEGDNEYLILQNDSLPLVISGNTIDLRYGNSFPANTTHTDSFLANGNAGFVNALNTYLNGSCDFSFVNGRNGDTIPVGALFIITSDNPTDTIDFSDWCGHLNGDKYVLFSSDPSWSSSGNFVNAPTSKRYFRLATPSDTTHYHYSNNWASTSDGNYAAWSDTGSASSYGNYPACQPNSVLSLPVEFIYTYMDGNVLRWGTASEINNLGFFVECQSMDSPWIEVGFKAGHGFSSSLKEYQYHLPLNSSYRKVRIKQVDYSGLSTYSKEFMLPDVVHIDPHIYWQKSLERIHIGNDFEYDFDVQIFSPVGQKLLITSHNISNDGYISSVYLQNGIYYICLISRHNTLCKKILILR